MEANEEWLARRYLRMEPERIEDELAAWEAAAGSPVVAGLVGGEPPFVHRAAPPLGALQARPSRECRKRASVRSGGSEVSINV